MHFPFPKAPHSQEASLSLNVRLTLATVCLMAVSAAALAGPGRAPKTYDLKNVEWHVTLHPEAGTIDGDVINSIHLLKAEDTVNFDCGPLTIGSVSVNGTPTTSSQVGETLTILLPDKGAKGDYKVEIKYSGKPTAGVYFVAARTAYPAHTPVVYTQGEAEDNRYWLPTYDYPDNKATSEGFITTPTGWKVLSNGKLLDEKTADGQTTAHWKMDKPASTYLISFVAGPYEVGHEKWGNMPVEYWVPEGLLDWGKAAFGGTGKIIDVYSKLTGFKYPYVKFAQSAVPDFMFGGMENITCVTQTISALFPPSMAETNDSTGLVAHELAHQWFGDTVTCEDWSHAWLNEGFATFMPPFYTRASKGEEAFQAERSGIFQGASSSFGDALPIVWTGYKIPMDNFLQNLIYPGGASRMYMLMDMLGEKTFWSGIHDYLETYKYQPVTTEKFFASMSKSSGKDLTGFMNEWFYSKGVPHITAKADGTSLVFTQSKPYFNIDPEAWIWNGKGWTKKKLHFTMDTPEVRVEVGAELAQAPLDIDPEGHYLLVQNVTQKVTPEQRAAIFDALPTFRKVRYANSLRSLDQATIAKLISEPKNKFYLGTLVRFLDKTNKDLLVSFATGPDAKLRNAAVGRLGSLYGKDAPDDIKALYQKLSTSDSSPEVQFSAFDALLNLTNDSAMVEKAWTTDSFRDQYRTTALQWWAEHDKASAKKHALEALDTPLSEPVQLTAIGMLGRFKDAPGEKVVYNHLIDVLKGTSYAERLTAMFSLVAYGDKAALTAIEPLTHESLFFTRQAAQGAYAQLKNGGGNGGEAIPVGD
jgi:aminopeptidase N